MKEKNKLKLPDNISFKGAEADIITTSWDNKDAIIKHRVSKSYRTKEIDDKLRNIRTKEEARLIHDSKKVGVKTPFIYSIDLVNYDIIMENINALQLQEIIENNSKEYLKNIMKNIATSVKKIHEADIIHGDLTTANILISDNDLYLIDFGLGKYSNLLEDKGTDLLVFKKSLTTIIPDESENLFNIFLEEYNDNILESEHLNNIINSHIKVEGV